MKLSCFTSFRFLLLEALAVGNWTLQTKVCKLARLISPLAMPGVQERVLLKCYHPNVVAFGSGIGGGGLVDGGGFAFADSVGGGAAAAGTGNGGIGVGIGVCRLSQVRAVKLLDFQNFLRTSGCIVIATPVLAIF